MIQKELKTRLRDQLFRVWRNSLMYGPIKHGPPSKKQCEDLGFTHEEGVDFYEQCLRESGMIETSPGIWDAKWRKDP